VTNAYKGMNYLIEACRQLADEHPEMKDEVKVVLLGSHADEVASELPFPAIAVGYVNDEQRMARLYRSADVFVLPSLSENLPNTIMEAMACGVPCLGFRVGGIPEEIDHQRTGYVARYRDAADLAHGLRWLLYEADSKSLSKECVRKVKQCYSQAAVAVQYTEIYQQAMAHKHFRL
jgi:glycosyltransferase involved in cell wall biosynthesis